MWVASSAKTQCEKTKKKKPSLFVWKSCSVIFPELYIQACWYTVENTQKLPGRGGKSEITKLAMAT